MKFLEENLLDHLQRPEFAELLSSLSPRFFTKGSYISQPGHGANLIEPDYKKAVEIMDKRIKEKRIALGLSA